MGTRKCAAPSLPSSPAPTQTDAAKSAAAAAAAKSTEAPRTMSGTLNVDHTPLHTWPTSFRYLRRSGVARAAAATSESFATDFSWARRAALYSRAKRERSESGMFPDCSAYVFR